MRSVTYRNERSSAAWERSRFVNRECEARKLPFSSDWDWGVTDESGWSLRSAFFLRANAFRQQRSKTRERRRGRGRERLSESCVVSSVAKKSTWRLVRSVLLAPSPIVLVLVVVLVLDVFGSRPVSSKGLFTSQHIPFHKFALSHKFGLPLGVTVDTSSRLSLPGALLKRIAAFIHRLIAILRISGLSPISVSGDSKIQ
jgi:hypothetical protein